MTPKEKIIAEKSSGMVISLTWTIYKCRDVFSIWHVVILNDSHISRGLEFYQVQPKL